MALTLVTSDLIHGLDYSKLTGTIPTWNQNTTGNAATATLAAGATILATARNIGGVSFNGSAAIDLPGVNAAGNQPTSGNAGTVTNGVYTVGDQTIAGVKTFSSNLKVEKSLNGDPQLLFVTNPNSGTATEAAIYVGNAALGVTSATTFMQTLGTGFSSTGGFIQDGSVIGTGTDISAGLSLMVRANADMRFYTNGHTNQRMIISSGGNVGIGTTSPSSKLHIRTSTNFNYEFEEVSSRLRLSALNDARSANVPLQFAASEFNFITGNVGIGTDSPDKQLTFIVKNDDAIQIRRYTTGQGAPAVGTGISWTWTSSGTDTETWAAIRTIMPGNGNTHMTFSTKVGSDSTATEKMRVTDVGNVGIGVTPSYKLHLLGGNEVGSRFIVTGTYAPIQFSGDNSTTLGAINAYAGNVVIGGGTATGVIGSLSISTSTGAATFTSNGSNAHQHIIINQASSPYSIWMNHTTVKNNNGNDFIRCAEGTSTNRFYLWTNGGIGNYQSNDSNLSDERVKKEISLIPSYWDKFKALEIVKFKYKDQTTENFNIGIIAQQVESVAPEFINNEGWGELEEGEEPLKSVYTADLYHATIKVLQEAMTKIESQQTIIEDLKARIETLEG
jgi:hypothetical protein